METLVGIVGGYGAVGEVIAHTLYGDGYRIRIGGRHAGTAAALVDRLGGAATAHTVDVFDPADLAAFCAGCAVVVNCAGPSYRILDLVARAALAAGAHYVDAGGDDPLFERLVGLDTDRVVILSAGMAPGLTGLLPRWLAGRDGTGGALTVYVSARDRFTEAAAGDYLLSLGNGYGEPMACIRDGTIRPRGLEPLRDVTLPFFDGRVTAYPFLSTEALRLADALRLDELRWYNVFDADGQMLTAMSQAAAYLNQTGDLAAACATLVRAADVDLFGRGPRQQFVVELAHGDSGRTLVLRATGTYVLTGVVCATAVRAVSRGGMAAGRYFAADVLDPAECVDAVRAAPGVDAFEVVESAIAVEEGVL